VGELILILGGARSGKSSFAQKLAQELGGEGVLFVATAEAGDDEMRTRIEKHKRERPPGWQTLEAPRHAGQSIVDHPGEAQVILFDCLTLLVSNLVVSAPDPFAPEVEQQVTSEVESLFATPTEETEPIISEEEQEQLRLDNLKRKYQNAIGRLPYGIPSKELAGGEWVDLASALATGEKKETPGGREMTEIDGRWYYSDVKDTGTFLKEYGPKHKEGKKVAKEAAVVTADKTDLLAKLEERFILGEVSEEAYFSLKDKLEKE